MLKKRIISILLATALVSTTGGFLPNNTAVAKTLNTATFAYLDVGQGNSELIKAGSTTTLIDTGKKSEYDELNFQLKKLKVKKINTLVVSHPDADHMESADSVIAKYHVKKIVMPKIKATTQCYRKMMGAVKKYHVKVIYPAIGQKIKLAPSCRASILSVDASSTDKNEASIVMRVIYGSRSFLYMGDATARVESNILTNDSKVASDVYLLSHHGSDTANGVLFVKRALSSKYKNAVISVGANNSYGHPVKQIVRRADKYSKVLYRTDKNGAIIYKTNGSSLKTSFIKVSHSGTKKHYNKSKTKRTSTKETTREKSSNSKGYVYITRTGKKYHRASCRYLQASKTKIKLSEAKQQGYTACKVCY